MSWSTVEEPVELEQAVGAVEDTATLIVDCLSLWVSNVIEHQAASDIEAAAARAAQVAATRSGLTIAVSNEVGLGIVPVNPLARAYRDVLGRVNALWVAAAAEAYFVVAGRTTKLEELR